MATEEKGFFNSLPGGKFFGVDEMSAGGTTSGFTNTPNYSTAFTRRFDGEVNGVCSFGDGSSSMQFNEKSCRESGGTFRSAGMVRDDTVKNANPNWSRMGMVPIAYDQQQFLENEVLPARAADRKAQEAGLDVRSDLFKQYGDSFKTPEDYMSGLDERGVDFTGSGPLSTANQANGEPSVWNAFQDQGAALNAAENKRLQYIPRSKEQIESGEAYKPKNLSLFNNIQDNNQRMLNQPPLESGLPSGSPWKPQSPNGYNAASLLNSDASSNFAKENPNSLRETEEARIANETNALMQQDMEETYTVKNIKFKVTGNDDIDSALSTAITVAQNAGVAIAENVDELLVDFTPKLKELANVAATKGKGLLTDISATGASIFNNLTAEKETTGGTGATHVMPDGSVMQGATHEDSTVVTQPVNGQSNTKKENNVFTNNGTAQNVINNTLSDKGFNMSRITDPFSKDNKSWWLEKRPGDVPGNNRAVEFFNALAYIGTPMKYRPAKTPMETLQERRIQHSNNMMDAASSRQTALNTASNAKYTRFKNMITTPAILQDAYLTDDKSDGWFERTFGKGLSAQEKKARSYETAININQIMGELAMAGIPPSKSVAEGLYTIRQASGRPVVSIDGQITEEEKRLATLSKKDLKKEIGSAQSGAIVSNYFSLKQ